MLVALIATVVLARGRFLLNIGMSLLGLLLGTVGTDIESGTMRFTFGSPNLADGINFVIVAVGVFAFAEVIANLGRGRTTRASAASGPAAQPVAAPVRPRRHLEAHPARHRCWVRRWDCCPAPDRWSVPSPPTAWSGNSPSDRTRFGNGAIEGVAGPEAANNAAAHHPFHSDADAGDSGRRRRWR